ncbi:hypothetical protein POPTR_004G104101v4 [Populus trichocarpa]|uniref:Uncharacterized protein n=1 Tax=Populus trichocarpa TaxID=3694 RepID=A0ACC0T4J5_POPTR|nr:hypothetical protein POPTR_004G104101v4 [Populus trichocarpa]
MYRHTVRDFDLSSFLSKRWNRITWLKRNDHTSIMHYCIYTKLIPIDLLEGPIGMHLVRIEPTNSPVMSWAF